MGNIFGVIFNIKFWPNIDPWKKYRPFNTIKQLNKTNNFFSGDTPDATHPWD